MKKILVLVLVLLLLAPLIVYAEEEHNFEEVEQLIQNKVSCDELTEDQLESIGDYYMEQMHPGEAHELMDEMMGGEGSASLKQMHINMAYRIYCGYNTGGMMGSGAGMMGFGGGMMNNMMGGGNMMANYGMMGWGYGMSWFGGLIQILVVVALVLLIVWLIKQISKKK